MQLSAPRTVLNPTFTPAGGPLSASLAACASPSTEHPHRAKSAHDVVEGSAPRHRIGVPHQCFESCVRQISWCSNSVGGSPAYLEIDS
jgi:hypothetical protein